MQSALTIGEFSRVTHLSHGDVIVSALMDGEYDKTNLPDELILTHYFTVRRESIVTLIIIRNTPLEH